MSRIVPRAFITSSDKLVLTGIIIECKFPLSANDKISSCLCRINLFT